MRGYRKIAALMGKYPELGMVSQFSSLNIQTLLYRQAEIISLQQDLQELEDSSDRSPDEEKRKFSRDWNALSSAEEKDGSDEQWKLVLLIRERLKEYNDAVLQYSELSKLPSPNTRDLKSLQEWMERPSMGSIFLIGRDRNVWKNGQELITLQRRPQVNQFSLWLTDKATSSLTFSQKADPEAFEYAQNTIHYSDSTVCQIVGFLGTITASLLPVSAIVVLYFITTMGMRLGLVSGFTAIFAICLWFMTDGRLIEVFGATSTFAAVQVVFISTNITSTS